MATQNEWWRGPLAVWDVETTGLEPGNDRILEIAVVRYDDGEESGSWSRLVDVPDPIPDEASKIHGITRDVIEDSDALPFCEHADALRELMQGRTQVTYSGLHFDRPFLWAELGRMGRTPKEAPMVDLLVWVRDIDRFVPGAGRHRLEATCARHGVTMGAAHRALTDARATGQLLQKLAPRMPSKLSLVLSRQLQLADAQEREYARYRAKVEAMKGASK
jgi:DNA polymerase-3 subunit epsilon